MRTAQKKIWGHLVVFLVLLILSGCATAKDTVVLLQDADGKVGLITITTKAGAKTLNAPNTVVEVTGSGTHASDPETMDRSQIDSIFSDSMNALPLEPVTFILYFLHDTTELTARSKSLIPEVLSLITDRQNQEMFYEISIIGHTDTTGDDELNMRLSCARAEIVRNILLSSGIRLGQMEIGYHGAWDPAVRTGNHVREPRNRRVEIIIR